MPIHRHENGGNILVFDTSEQVAIAAAQRFVEYAQEAVSDHGFFSVTLAGGNTPRRVYEILGTEDFKSHISWRDVHLFFGDERCVPPDDPDSNYRMVYESMISKIPIPSSRVHRIIGEGDADANAQSYERELKSFFAGLSWPRFDLVLLGMGDDGHTASLFPGDEALNDATGWVTKTRIERLKQDRITLTVPVFNHAAHAMFLVTGEGKAKRLVEVLRGPFDPKRLPAQAIQLVSGSLQWLIDKAAASLL
ncbi:MAG: 6-phosphogluconolactonase [Acidobacteriota bacterium]|nr:6-phosphogluconolactonase [Acidobacteriota bacterium]